MSSVPIPLPHMSPSWVLGHLLAVIIAPSGDTDACSAMTHRQSSPIHAPFSRRDSVRLRRICSGYHRELELDLEFLAPTLEKTYYRVNTQAKVSKKKNLPWLWLTGAYIFHGSLAECRSREPLCGSC